MQTKPTIRVEQTSWQINEPEIRRIRTAVFVEEQNVPLALDFDGLDPQCIHWLAYASSDRHCRGRETPRALLACPTHCPAILQRFWL
jgi:predicted GNAT family N-acyltransferase